MLKQILLRLGLLILLTQMATAQVPETINFQGALKDGAGQALADGTYKLTFKLYQTETGGSALWIEEQSVVVTDGILNAILGKVTTFASANIIFNKPFWLGISVQDDAEMTPRFELSSSPYALNPAATTGGGGVPVGTVIDWWRPNNNFTVPTGFKICDGGTVSDNDSPLNGFNVPDLRNKFIRGAESLEDIGETGGSATHKHAVDPLSAASNSAGDHAHSVDPPNAQSTNHSGHQHSVNPPSVVTSEVSHQHQWSTYSPSQAWHTWTNGGGITTLIDWDDGIGNSGSGNYPLARKKLTGGTIGHFTSINRHDHTINIGNINSTIAGSHVHQTDISPFNSSSTGSHSHDVDIASFDAEMVSHTPEYYGLLKLIKIK